MRNAWIVSLLLLAVGAPTAGAQTPDPNWLRSLEELMNIEVVTASRRERALSDTASAVFVLTREDIRRSGSTTVPDVLRLVPGVHVAQIDGNKWAVTVRGFNSRWANKLLVMVDGRTAYSDAFSGVYWDALDVPVELIERIEIVRGPGGSLWGANAVNGVINIFTRGASTNGGAVTATAGAQGQLSGVARYAGSMGPRFRYHAFSGFSDSENTGPATNDYWRSLRVGGGLSAQVTSRDVLTLDATYVDGDSGAQVVTRLTSLSPLLFDLEDSQMHPVGRQVSGSWTRSLSNGGGVRASAGWTDAHRDDYIVVLDSQAVEAAMQHTAPRVGNHEMTWGANYRRSTTAMPGSGRIRLELDRNLQTQSGVYVQDDIYLAAERVQLTIGAKVERFSHTGWHWQPTIRAHWHPAAGHTAWAAVSRAVRTPSVVERGMRMTWVEIDGPIRTRLDIVGNLDLRVESLRSVEAGYRWAARAVSIDVAAYGNAYDDLINVEAGVPYVVTGPGAPYIVQPMPFHNTMTAAATGVEALLTVAPTPRWRLTGGYTLFTLTSRSNAGRASSEALPFDADTPRHQGSLRSALTLPHSVEVDSTLLYVGDLDLAQAPSYVRLDARVGWRPRAALELSLVALNALDGRQVEFPALSNGTLHAESRRQFLLRAAWGF